MHDTIATTYTKSQNLKLPACYSICIQNIKEKKKTCIVAAAAALDVGCKLGCVSFNVRARVVPTELCAYL